MTLCGNFVLLLCTVQLKQNIMDISINRIELRGNVGQEPRVTEVGENKVIKFTVATNERFKDRQGVLKEETKFKF